MYELIKSEYTYFDFFSSLGGFGSLLLGIQKIISVIEMPQLFVASDMLASKDTQVKRQGFDFAMHSKEAVQQNFCTSARVRLGQIACLPQCCKMRVLRLKDRILAKAHSDLKREMSIIHLLKQLRVTEAVLKKRLEITQDEWDRLYDEHGGHTIFQKATAPDNLVNFFMNSAGFNQGVKIGANHLEPPSSTCNTLFTIDQLAER